MKRTIRSEFLRRNAFTISIIGTAFLIAILLSFFSFRQNIRNVRLVADEKMKLETNSFIALSSEQFLAGVQALRSAGGFFAGSENVTRPEFYHFVEASKFLKQYKGFQTFAYAPLVSEADKAAFLSSVVSDTSYKQQGYPSFALSPSGERPEYLPISYIYPEDQVGFLMGLDSYGDAVRTENANRARDMGEVSVSGLVQLGEGGIGVIVAYPVYKTAEIPQSIEDRRRLFQGILTTVIDVKTFFSLVFASSNLAAYGIDASISGRTGQTYPIYKHSEQRNIFSAVYGSISKEETVPLTDTTTFLLKFEAPIHTILSFQELFIPFLYVSLFLSAAILMSVVIIIAQRTKTIADLKQRYSFISTLSHQLRTPIAKLRWAAESLKVSKPQREYHAEILKESDLMRSITDSLLTYIELSGTLRVHTSTVPTDTFCTSLFERIPPRERKRLTCSVGDLNGWMVGDTQKILQSITYVIDNALTYSPATSKVVVKITEKHHRLRIQIIDTGIGIPQKDQENIFKEFFRASNASLRKNAGSGVSLYIVKKIIEAHRGTIEFTSQEGKGTEFVIELPFVMNV